MRRYTLLGIFVLAATGFAIPPSTYASDVGWRGRASSGEEITSSDIATEIAFGREIASRILGRYKSYGDTALIKYVSLVGLALARNTNRPELEYHFTVLDTDEVNAYAAPGGYVFVTKGALLLMKDESELAGVLAHEISHITEKHVVKELKIKGTDDSVVSGLAQLVGGSSESARAAFSQAIEQGLDMIFNNGYKREDEMLADKMAVSLSALSGYDSSGLARYLDRISSIKDKDTETTDRIHPSSSARIAQINKVMAENGIDAGGLATNRERFALAIKSLNKSGL